MNRDPDRPRARVPSGGAVQHTSRDQPGAHPHERTQALAEQIRRERWMAPIHGGLPQVPRREALPNASADLHFCMIGVDGTPSVVYICLKDSMGAYAWEVAATG
ncbi:MAG: hypothetical protein ACKVT1_01270 [Dehalococcoidia bacterium]